jgi:methyl-accepting chemotaxis protein
MITKRGGKGFNQLIAFKLYQKLFAVVLMPLMALAFSMCIAFWSINNISETASDVLYNLGYQTDELVMNADRDMYQALIALRELVYDEDHSESFAKAVQSFQENRDQARERVSKARKILEDELPNMPLHPDSQKSAAIEFQSYFTAFDQWSDTVDALIRELSTKKITQTEFRNKMVATEESFELARSAINELNDINSTFVEMKMAESRHAAMQSTVFMTIIDLIIALISLVLAYLFIRNIIKTLKDKIGAGIKKMGGGDLTVDFSIDTHDEIGEIADELNQMREKLSELISGALESASRVGNGVQEIATGNQDLSQRTQEQASTLEEVASTVEEMTTSIQQTAANSSQADQISRQTMVAVEEGQKAVEEAAEAMRGITVSSKQVAEIIRVVNDIAFQTNLLALNAAVEAARAGEQGRGFAVVAAEVRNLAGRTTESSKEIEQLIKESVERVEKGNILVRRAIEVLQEIVTNTKHTSDVVMEIAASTREQSTASEQIQSAIEQLNMVTQQNAALVQEISSSSEVLNDEARSLTKSVSVFTTCS